MITNPESDPIAKAEVLLEALPYIQRFKGSTFLIKYGGGFMDDPDENLRLQVIRDIVLLSAVGVQIVIVHGGGKAISRAMEKAGLEPHFVQGLRVTDKESIGIVEKTLNKEINKEICELLARQKGKPLSLPGNTILNCRKIERFSENGELIDLGFVGEIQKVATDLVECGLAGGYIPVLSSIATDSDDNVFNTNADEAASHVASALSARRLVYLCDVPGLLREPEDPSSLIRTLYLDQVDELKDSGVISSGMLPKVDSAVRAIQAGVRRVHFIDGRMPHSILLEIFTDQGIGTEIRK